MQCPVAGKAFPANEGPFVTIEDWYYLLTEHALGVGLGAGLGVHAERPPFLSPTPYLAWGPKGMQERELVKVVQCLLGFHHSYSTHKQHVTCNHITWS